MNRSPEQLFQEVSPEIKDKIKLAFKMFDTNGTGKINPKEIKAAMKHLGQDKINPTVYQFLSLLEESEDSNEGITFDQFITSIYQKLGDNKTESGIRRLFELFKDDSQANSIDLKSLKKISEQLGENIAEKDIEEMMKRISKGENQLTFEQFYDIISKQ